MVIEPGAKFGRKKEEAIAALLTHRNIEEAAHAAKIGTNTLLRWMKELQFDAAYREARRQSVHQSVARMKQATGAAGLTILKIMTDPNVPAAVRLRAAECVFDRAIKGIELEDIEARLAELERSADENKPGWRKSTAERDEDSLQNGFAGLKITSQWEVAGAPNRDHRRHPPSSS